MPARSTDGVSSCRCLPAESTGARGWMRRPAARKIEQHVGRSSYERDQVTDTLQRPFCRRRSRTRRPPGVDIRLRQRGSRTAHGVSDWGAIVDGAWWRSQQENGIAHLRKPCVRLRFSRLGWYVRFVAACMTSSESAGEAGSSISSEEPAGSGVAPRSSARIHTNRHQVSRCNRV